MRSPLRLIALDDPRIRRTLDHTPLERIGVSVEYADARQIASPSYAASYHVCVVDASAAGLSVAEQVAHSPGGARPRVLLLCRELTAKVFDSVLASDVDDWLLTPCRPHDLITRVRVLCGLGLRVPLTAPLPVRVSGLREPGWAIEIDGRGMLLKVSTSLALGRRVSLVVQLGGQELELSATIVRQDDAAKDCFGLHFHEIDDGAARLLNGANLLYVEDLGVAVALRFRHAIINVFELGWALEQLPDKDVVVDLQQVQRINSVGVGAWVDFIGALGRVHPRPIWYVNCGDAFARCVAMVAGMLGRGTLVSLQVNYSCDECRLGRQQLVRLEQALAEQWPLCFCPSCHVPLQVEAPEELLALHRQRAGR